MPAGLGAAVGDLPVAWGRRHAARSQVSCDRSHVVAYQAHAVSSRRVIATRRVSTRRATPSLPPTHAAREWGGIVATVAVELSNRPFMSISKTPSATPFPNAAHLCHPPNFATPDPFPSLEEAGDGSGARASSYLVGDVWSRRAAVENQVLPRARAQGGGLVVTRRRNGVSKRGEWNTVSRKPV